MRTHRLSLVAALLVAAPLGAQQVTKDAAPAAAPAAGATAGATDPVGSYDWSLQAGDQAFTGTLVVTRAADASLGAIVTSLSDPNPMRAKVVKIVDGNRLVVTTDTQYGEFTMDVKLGATLEGKWTVGDGTSNGELKIVRKKS